MSGRLLDLGAFDCLNSTLAAAKEAGFRLVATASIHPTSEPGQRVRGMRRAEHMVHLEKGWLVLEAGPKSSW